MNGFIFKYNLITMRKRNKLTQKAMAAELGVTEGCYAHWEQGRNEPSIDCLIHLCQILHVSADELLGLKAGEQNLPTIDEQAALSDIND